MTTKEAMVRKAQLEVNILELIRTFEEEVEFHVRSVDLTNGQTFGDISRRTILVRCDVSVPSLRIEKEKSSWNDKEIPETLDAGGSGLGS